MAVGVALATVAVISLLAWIGLDEIHWRLTIEDVRTTSHEYEAVRRWR